VRRSSKKAPKSKTSLTAGRQCVEAFLVLQIVYEMAMWNGKTRSGWLAAGVLLLKVRQNIVCKTKRRIDWYD